MMKKIVWMTVLTFCILLAGCNGKEEQGSDAPESDSTAASGQKTATLYVNMEIGSESAQAQQYAWTYSGDLTAEILADGLSQTTGLEFTISAAAVGDGIAVDWKADSTLVATLGDREQKEAFHFYDADSMRWSMMDSLWMTLTKNLDTENVYYTMDGGQELSVQELYPVQTIPADLPYMGSAFYFAHADGQGGLDEGRGDLITMTQTQTEEIVREAMTSQQRESLMLAGGGEDTIYAEHAFIVIAGNKSADGRTFTELHHYAVTDSGAIYCSDLAQGTNWQRM